MRRMCARSAGVFRPPGRRGRRCPGCVQRDG